MRMIFVAMGKESLFKGLERAARLGRCSNALKEELCKSMPQSLVDAMRTSIDGDALTGERFGLTGEWEAFALGACAESDAAVVRPASMQFLCDVERASRRPAELCREGRFLDAAEALANDELMKHFLSPVLERAFGETANFDDLMLVRAFVAIEVWLSLLAIWDIEARPSDVDDGGSFLALLIPAKVAVAKNPVALLFDWLLNAAHVPTAAALARDPRLDGVRIDSGTLGAWSRGTNFPRSAYMKVISRALLSAEDAATFQVLCAVARQLNFLGYVAQDIHEKIRNLEDTELKNHFSSWLRLPFGYDTIESWLLGRYPVWLQFHRARLGAGS